MFCLISFILVVFCVLTCMKKAIIQFIQLFNLYLISSKYSGWLTTIKKPHQEMEGVGLGTPDLIDIKCLVKAKQEND